MDAENLFLTMLDDLDHRIKSNDLYDLLNGARLMRQLILDGEPLMDKVNRKYKLKISFQITDAKPTLMDGLAFWNIQDGLDPATSRPGRQTLTVNREIFLGAIVATKGDKEFSVKETLSTAANVMGGVHLGEASDKEKLMEEINQQIAIGNLPFNLRQLKAIGRVVIETLLPLKHAIENKS